jgi:hypothetical protein
MRRLIPSLALALALLAAGTVRNSDARVSADINLRIGRPAPVVVFDQEPDVVLVPGTRVYYVDGQPYDLYRYGSYWYICDDGFWYRARNYRGPFATIDIGFVPRSIVSVPARFHRYPVRGYGGGGYYRGVPRYRGDYYGRDRVGGGYRGDWNRGDQRTRGTWGGNDRRGGNDRGNDRRGGNDRGNDGGDHGGRGDHGNRDHGGGGR